MKSLFLISLINSCLLMMSSHPVLLMTFILSQTMIVCLISWLYLSVSWFAFVLFLIFLGGLMVLFIYITSLASNEMMKIEAKNFLATLIFLASSLLMMSYFMNSQSTENSIFNSTTKNFFSMYSASASFLILASMIYLLLTLIVVVKISDKFNAPIKNLV
uniref:NADH-ubiquinone oxidoreductase chain 6 n=1 Tax=Cryptopygus antarcticus travei TaxID=359048 RepID=A0A5P9W7G9_CRYAT|nr:NADH dehydrogenase subunit 6 [Cryptopygus antarcticus travei]